MEGDFKKCKALDKLIKECRENNIDLSEFLSREDKICYDNNGNLSVNPLCYATSKRKLCMLNACSSVDAFKANLANNGITVSDKRLPQYEDVCEKTINFKNACKMYEADPNDPTLLGYSKTWLIKNAYELQKRALNSSLLPTSIIPSATQPGDVLQKTVSTKEGVAFSSQNSQGLDPKFIGVASVAEDGKICGPVVGNIGVYVYKVTGRDTGAFFTEDDAKNRDAQMTQYATQMVVPTMMDDADVKDNRARFF